MSPRAWLRKISATFINLITTSLPNVAEAADGAGLHSSPWTRAVPTQPTIMKSSRTLVYAANTLRS